MIRRLAYLVAIGLILSGSNTLAADSNKELLALSAAEQWLTMVDSGKYDDSWKETSDLFRNAVQLDQWVQSMQAIRKPLGKRISRMMKTTVYQSTLPGAPDGDYVVIQFDTSFENKKAAVETITPMLETDGAWRVSGYYIK
ncbi:hypothetical protein DSCA_47040 [Desulfosarcina alkanivorans]|uniref:DUF4019 domain-containing protein n=1 Tax=Desulfosarcina alkanivorans TaxID=571177 RepID=A0A5K7YWV1_9BACT|nr:DUF4019 domain-containing protein [Desulfosarcina alkanivorans]BBO70774.1 hypothetical protein DSCA_47040 [Desulfosarcina alkanivorans]